MRKLLRNCFCSFALIAAFAASAKASETPAKTQPPVSYAAAPWFQLFGGYVVAPDSWYGYAGGVAAFNRNLNQDGWLFRIAGGDGNYKYNIVPGRSHGVNFQTGDIMIGYQAYLGDTRITGYVGANVEDHHNNTDPLAKIKGTKWGIKGQGEIYAPLNQYWYLYALGTVSSVWNNYLAMGKVGYNITPVISFGPEVMALGNDRFDAIRTGPFFAFKITPSADLIVSVGYTWDERSDSLNDHSGVYATVHLRGLF